MGGGPRGGYAHGQTDHAAMTALGYYGYAAGTFAFMPVMCFLKDKLTSWPEHCRQQFALQRMGRLRLVDDARLDPSHAKQPYR